MSTKKKSGILGLLIMLLITSCGGCGSGNAVGEWIASSNTDAVIFKDDGSCEILNYRYDYTAPTTLPGSGITSTEGTRIPNSGKWRPLYSGTYTVDYSKDPAWIDIVIIQNGSPRRQEGLIQFLDDNTFYLAMEDVRPATIDNSIRGKTRFTKAAPNELNR